MTLSLSVFCSFFLLLLFSGYITHVQDLSSLTKDRIRSCCSGNVVS